MSFQRLSTHPFALLAVDEAAPLLKDSVSRALDAVSQGRDAPPRAPEDPRAPYESRVWRRFFAVMQRLTHMRESHRLIGWLPSKPQLDRLNFSEDQWYDHHYANYIVLAAGVPDVSFLLTNAVFNLGIPPRLCSERAIRQNSWVSGSPADHALGAVIAASSMFSEPRNLHLHRGVRPDVSARSGFADFRALSTASFVSAFVGDAEIRRSLRRPYRDLATKLQAEIQREIDALSSAVYDLFSALAPRFMERRKDPPAAR